MKSFLFRLLALFAFSAPLLADELPLNQLSDTEKAAGWQILFDGKDAGAWWRGYKKGALPEGWKTEDGALVRHGGGDIITKLYEIGSVDWQQLVAASKFAGKLDFAKLGPGHICLQDHGDEVAFRNIKIRPITTP